MPTLKKIATQAIDRLTEPYNEALYHDVKEHIVNLRNKYVKQVIDKSRIDESYQLTYSIELKEMGAKIVKVFNTLGAKTVELYTYKNKNSIPTVINTFRPAKYIKAYIENDSFDRTIARFIDASLIFDYFKSQYSKNTICYSVIGSILTVVSPIKLKTLNIEDVFEYPLIITDDYKIFNVAGIVFDDNAEFPIDSNMIPMVIEDIIKIYNGDASEHIQP